MSIVAKKTLPRGDLKNIMPTAAIRMGDEHVMSWPSTAAKGTIAATNFTGPLSEGPTGTPASAGLGKVLTKVALERSRIVLCSPDWGAHGGNEYWRALLDKLTLTSIQLPDDARYLPLGRKMPIGKPGSGSMLSVVDGSLATVP